MSAPLTSPLGGDDLAKALRDAYGRGYRHARLGTDTPTMESHDEYRDAWIAQYMARLPAAEPIAAGSEARVGREQIEALIRRHVWVKPEAPGQIIGINAAAAEIATLIASAPSPEAGAGGDLGELERLSAAAPAGEWHPDLYDAHDEDGGPTEVACDGIVSHDGEDDRAGQIASCGRRVAEYVCALVNKHRAGRLGALTPETKEEAGASSVEQRRAGVKDGLAGYLKAHWGAAYEEGYELGERTRSGKLVASTGSEEETKGASWRPIETAPKDGTSFLATHEKSGVRQITWFGKASHVPLYGWAHGDEAEDIDLWSPTHWMPLPAPPPFPDAALRTLQAGSEVL